MSAFEFFFSFYGLILGLSVVEVITGFSRVLNTQKPIPIGYLTPLLAVFVLLDVTSFWHTAWLQYQTLHVSYGVLVLGLVVAASYYFAASQILPNDPREWASLDAFYDKHKRLVIIGIGFANLVVFDVVRFFTAAGLRQIQEIWASPIDFVISYGYYVALVGILISKSRRIDGAVLTILILMYARDIATSAWIAPP